MRIIFKDHSSDWFIEHEIVKAIYVNGRLAVAALAALFYGVI